MKTAPAANSEASGKNRFLIRLVDDEEDVRTALAILLECAGWRTKAYACAEDFLKDPADFEPGCVVLDLLMPSMNGLELQSEMHSRGIELPIVFVTGHATVESAVSAMRKGAVHFLQKPVGREALFAAIEEACADSLVLKDPPRLSEDECLKRLERLTPRRRDVLRLVLEGLQSREIGTRLGISHRTVLGHRAAINRIFEIQTPADLKRLAEFVKAIELKG